MREQDDDHRRKIIRGMKELNTRCHCGKMRVNHHAWEVIQCRKARQSGAALVTKVSQRELLDMRLQKI